MTIPTQKAASGQVGGHRILKAQVKSGPPVAAVHQHDRREQARRRR